MDDQNTGPVSAADGDAAVSHLRALAQRAADHRQTTFHFVFSIAADSLADNVEQVADWGDDDAE